VFNNVRTPTSSDVDSWAASFANYDESTTVPWSTTKAFAARIVELNAREEELKAEVQKEKDNAGEGESERFRLRKYNAEYQDLVVELRHCLTRCGLTAGMRVDDSPSQIADRVEARASRLNVVDIVFDGPPGLSGRFVEVEDSSGKSITLGEWVERADGYWVLRLTAQRGEGESNEPGI
jgi:hypothetical protein